MVGITILGSTGTIGVNTLDVIERNRSEFEVVALTANRNVDALFAQCQKWLPRFAGMADEQRAEELQQRVTQAGLPTMVLGGTEGLEQAASAPEVDQVMAGIVGGAGLLPSLAAARAGKRVLLANKEALVMSGQLFMDAVRNNGAELVPIDSEHNAIFQCLPHQWLSDHGTRGHAAPTPGGEANGAVDPARVTAAGVNRILLTGSGGPFRTLPSEELVNVTPERACAHPNWVMGPKISVDSATMMNKGLEVIEACWLFNTDADHIEVVIHPQSVIHSMVEYVDGSVLAQLGNPDMRTPIAHALCWPERMTSGVSGLDFAALGRLDFEAPDFEKMPCLRLAFEAARAGGGSATVLNAANEIAVEAFLNRNLKFPGIARVVEATLGEVHHGNGDTLEKVLAVDAEARSVAAVHVERLGP